MRELKYRLSIIFFSSLFFNLSCSCAHIVDLPVPLETSQAGQFLTDNSSLDSDVMGFDLGDLNLNAVEAIEKTRMPAGDLGDIAVFLNNVVKTPIWNKTVAPAGRDILYLLPYKISSIEYGGFAVNLFFNTTNKMKTTAGDLLDLTNAVNQDNLDVFLQQIFKDRESTEISQLMPLFKNVTVQERRGGALFQGGIIKGPYTVQLNTSFQVAERNFWLSQQDRDQISSYFSKDFSGSSFDVHEVYRIRYGLGDTRLKFGLNTMNLSSFQLDVGLEGIIPTSRLSHTQRYDITLGTITGLDSFQRESLKALRGTRSYILDPRLGNGGHWGLGCYCESKANLFHDLAQLWTRFSFDKLLPCNEDRLFLHKVTMEPGNVTADESSINTFMREYVFPSSYKVTIYPGGIFNAVVCLSTSIKKWRFAVGYDFYSQQPESITAIHDTTVNLQTLKVEDAQADRVLQHKVFAESLYIKKYSNKELAFGLGGDTTIHARGIGYDWTLYGKLTATF